MSLLIIAVCLVLITLFTWRNWATLRRNEGYIWFLAIVIFLALMGGSMLFCYFTTTSRLL